MGCDGVKSRIGKPCELILQIINSSVMMTEVANSSKLLVKLYYTSQSHTAEDINVYSHRYDANLA